MSNYDGMTRGGNGSHWAGCEAAHWDCRLAQAESRVTELERMVDGFWECLENSYDIEPREYFETHWSFDNCTSGPLFMAAHYMGKRDARGTAAETRVAELEAEVARLREALEWYGDHVDRCRVQRLQFGEEKRCVCGFDKALEAQP